MTQVGDVVRLAAIADEQLDAAAHEALVGAPRAGAHVVLYGVAPSSNAPASSTR